jgi:chromosomal replication initiation ATPase DnaA
MDRLIECTDRSSYFPSLPNLTTPQPDLIDTLAAVLSDMGATGSPLLVVLARRTLVELERIRNLGNLSFITAQACRALRADPDQIINGKSRLQHTAFCRQVAMYFCRKISNASFPTIGEFFNRDHSTIIAACRAIERRMSDPAFAQFMSTFENRITGAALGRAQATASAKNWRL